MRSARKLAKGLFYILSSIIYTKALKNYFSCNFRLVPNCDSPLLNIKKFHNILSSSLLQVTKETGTAYKDKQDNVKTFTILCVYKKKPKFLITKKHITNTQTIKS